MLMFDDRATVLLTWAATDCEMQETFVNRVLIEAGQPGRLA